MTLLAAAGCSSSPGGGGGAVRQVTVCAAAAAAPQPLRGGVPATSPAPVSCPPDAPDVCPTACCATTLSCTTEADDRCATGTVGLSCPGAAPVYCERDVAVDASGHGNDLVVATGSELGPGRFGQGLTGSCQAATVGAPAGFPGRDEPVTIEAWVRAPSQTGNRVLGWGGRSDLGITFEAGSWRLTWCTRALPVAAPLGDGAWHFVGVAASPPEARLFVDGAYVGSVQDGSCPTEHLGAEAALSLAGGVDEVRVLARAAADTLVASDYADGPMTASADTVALWHFGDPTVTWCCGAQSSCATAPRGCTIPMTTLPACGAAQPVSCGTGCCPPGSECRTAGATASCVGFGALGCPPDHPVLCGDGACCPADTVCSADGSGPCRSRGSAPASCAAGTPCASGGCCEAGVCSLYSCDPAQQLPTPLCPSGQIAQWYGISSSALVCCPAAPHGFLVDVLSSVYCTPTTTRTCRLRGPGNTSYTCSSDGDCPTGFSCCAEISGCVAASSAGLFCPSGEEPCAAFPLDQATRPGGCCPGGSSCAYALVNASSIDTGLCCSEKLADSVDCCGAGCPAKSAGTCAAGEVACGHACCPAGSTCAAGSSYDDLAYPCLLADPVPRACAVGTTPCGTACCPAGASCTGGECVQAPEPPSACASGQPCGDHCCDGDLCIAREGWECAVIATAAPTHPCPVGCETGHVHEGSAPCLCPGGTPAPAGPPCGDAVRCADGAVCAAPGVCCDAASPRSCGGACCPADATCDECGCPGGYAACGAACCAPGVPCADGACGSRCLDADFPDPCGDWCRAEDVECADDRTCRCPDDHPVPCGDTECCLPGAACADGACACPSGREACGDRCCDAGQSCRNGTCGGDDTGGELCGGRRCTGNEICVVSRACSVSSLSGTCECAGSSAPQCFDFVANGLDVRECGDCSPSYTACCPGTMCVQGTCKATCP